MLDIIASVAEFTEVKTELSICRDPKDNFLLSLCVDSGADYLISGDNDLLEIKVIGDTRIINMASALEVLKG